MEGLIVLGVIIFVIVSVIKGNKNKTKTGDKASKSKTVDTSQDIQNKVINDINDVTRDIFNIEVKKADKVEDEAEEEVDDEVFNVGSNPTNIASSDNNAVTDSTAKSEKQADISNTYAFAPGDLAKNYKPIEGTLKEHTHGGGTREEKNIPTEHSMGNDVAKQGCAEHYNSRFVKDAVILGGDENDVIQKKNLKLAIVLGEVINKPAFKRRNGKIR